MHYCVSGQLSRHIEYLLGRLCRCHSSKGRRGPSEGAGLGTAVCPSEASLLSHAACAEQEDLSLESYISFSN